MRQTSGPAPDGQDLKTIEQLEDELDTGGPLRDTGLSRDDGP